MKTPPGKPGDYYLVAHDTPPEALCAICETPMIPGESFSDNLGNWIHKMCGITWNKAQKPIR